MCNDILYLNRKDYSGLVHCCDANKVGASDQPLEIKSIWRRDARRIWCEIGSRVRRSSPKLRKLPPIFRLTVGGTRVPFSDLKYALSEYSLLIEGLVRRVEAVLRVAAWQSCRADLQNNANVERQLLMTLAQAYGPDKFGLSFELFPPKTEKGMTALVRHVGRLVDFRPNYITCTYGAGGSTQDRTLEVIAGIHEQHNLPVATHLTCVGRTPDELRDYLVRASELGIQNVVALRGDPPQGETEFRPVEGGFSYANELVAFIRSEFADLGIAVGGYPETHQEAPSAEADIENLKRKVDAGADVVITQLFYDNDEFYNFRERCQQAGIKVPIVPGLLPVTNAAQVQRIASLCGAKLPPQFVADLQKYADDAEGQFNVGVEYAAKQTADLIEAGVAGIHYYVLNKSEAAERVLNAVSLPR